MNPVRIYRYARLFLIPLIPVYLLAFYIRRFISKPERFNIPIICVGNITTGGTGKTPAVIYLAKILKDAGFYPGIVSRGYRGSGSKQGAIVTDGHTLFLTPRESGDEPFLIARSLKNIPVAICSNRARAIHNLINRYKIDLVIMDDGFQNNSVYKNIAIIIIDATNPFGNGLLLPAGDLREGVFSLRRSNMILINRSDLISKERHDLLTLKIRKMSLNKIIFNADYHDEFLYQINNKGNRIPLSEIKNKRILIISSIGNPMALAQTISKYHPDCVKLISYRDHYSYTADDIKNILIKSDNFDFVITTEKDHVKMPNFRFNEKFYVLKISMRIKEMDLFKEYIESLLKNINKTC